MDDEQIRNLKKTVEAVQNITIGFAALSKQMVKSADIFNLWKGETPMSYNWVMQNKNGQSNKTKLRNQTMLKGRGKRTRTGVYPGRGKGRTAHGRRG